MRSGFVVAMVGMVVGLVLLGWRVSAATDALEDVKRAAGDVDVGSFVAQAEEAAAMATAQGAVAMAEAWIAEQGTASGLTTDALRALDSSLDSIAVVAAGDGGYCIEATVRSATVHAMGPGSIGSGPCP